MKNKSVDAETTILTTEASFDIGTDNIMIDHSDNKWYDITVTSYPNTFNVRYVGFWRNLKYRFESWIKNRKQSHGDIKT